MSSAGIIVWGWDSVMGPCGHVRVDVGGHTGAALRPTAGADRRTEDNGDRRHRRRGADNAWGRRCPSFAEMLTDHLHNRTNLRTCAAMASNPWLFPGRNAGKHLDPQTIQMRLHNRGISVLGARNSALQNLVAEIPPPVVANLLGYSHTCTQYHAQLAAQTWARYVP